MGRGHQFRYITLQMHTLHISGMKASIVIRGSLLLAALLAKACSAQLPLPTALPNALNVAAELRNHIRNGRVLSAVDGAAFNATLQGYVLSGLQQDYGKVPAITVQPIGARHRCRNGASLMSTAAPLGGDPAHGHVRTRPTAPWWLRV